MSLEKTLRRAEEEMHAGRIWRAKEILRGTITAGHAEPILLERYGQLLDALGERLEAGRYLFASGARQPQYEEPIRLFLDRTARAKPEQFAMQLPAAMRRTPFTNLPPALQEELRARGVPQDRFHARAPAVHPGDERSWVVRAQIAGALTILIIFLLALVVGIATIGEWIFQHFE